MKYAKGRDLDFCPMYEKGGGYLFKVFFARENRKRRREGRPADLERWRWRDRHRHPRGQLAVHVHVQLTGMRRCVCMRVRPVCTAPPTQGPEGAVIRKILSLEKNVQAEMVTKKNGK